MIHSPVPLTIREPEASDAAVIWRLVEGSETLDHNSFYLYFVVCRFFARTSAIAYDGANAVGFVSAFCPPEDETTLFVWQIRVAPQARHRGVARALVEHVLSRPGLAIAQIQATVSPTNGASLAVFQSVARGLSARLRQSPLLGTDDFPHEAGDHLAEDLITIGPIGDGGPN